MAGLRPTASRGMFAGPGRRQTRGPMVVIRTPQEIRAAYEVQLRALEASCAGYDAGNVWESVRLATSVYTLVSDGGRKNQSIVTRLGLRRKILFLASGPKIEGSNVLMYQPLVALRLQRHPDNSRSATYGPLLGAQPENHRWVRRDEWWNSDQIYRNGPMTMTRKRLVFTLRNQEGGSHFGAITDASYVGYAINPAWTFKPADGPSHKVHGIEHATMRQIAWELLETLKAAA